MARQIIKQPNGLYCLYSSYTDSIVVWNLTKEQIIEFMMKDHLELITKEVERIVGELNEGKKPYYQFTVTFDEALAETKKRYPDDYEKFMKEIC